MRCAQVGGNARGALRCLGRRLPALGVGDGLDVEDQVLGARRTGHARTLRDPYDNLVEPGRFVRAARQHDGHDRAVSSVDSTVMSPP